MNMEWTRLLEEKDGESRPKRDTKVRLRQRFNAFFETAASINNLEVKTHQIYNTNK
jgi:hypothetical protein